MRSTWPHARTGVNTGEVIAGDHRRGHQFVTGEAVTGAKRLEEAGAPGEILIGAATHRLVRDAVEVVPSGSRSLKSGQTISGFTVLRVLAHTPGHARSFDSPFIGREVPRALLRATFHETVRRRTCDLLTVLGDAGLGKSRLVQEFAAEIAGDATVIRGAADAP